MIASVIDVREWQRLEKGSELAFDEPLASFERLLADLSATFINVPSEQVDGVIQDAQQRIVDALDLDRTTLWIAEDGDLVRSHDWTPRVPTRSMVSVSGANLRPRALPWSLEKTNAGELVQFSSVDELPDDPDRESYRRFGTKSTVVVPLRVGGPNPWRSGIRRRPRGAVMAASHREPPAARLRAPLPGCWPAARQTNRCAPPWPRCRN